MRAILVLLFSAALAHADDHFLQLPVGDSGKTLRLQIAITVEGQPPENAHEAFLDRLFDYFDRDADGSFTAEEAARIFAIPAGDGRLIAPKFAIAKGQCSRAEFKQFYRRAGFTPVAAVMSPSGAEVAKANASLFYRLDRDADGRLSKAELEKAPAILRALDLDEDEVLTIAELLADPLYGKELTKEKTAVSWAASGKDAQTDGVLSVHLGKKVQPPELRNLLGNAFHVIADGTGAFGFGDGLIQLTRQDSDPQARIQATREFYLTPFKSALGDKKFLEKRQIEDDSSLAFLGSLFPFADRNGDGRLTLAELEAFLDLIELGVRSQVIVTINDEGRSLISLLDENHDLQLDRRELTRAVRLLPKEKESLTRQDIPRRLTVSIAQGTPGRVFGPALIVGNRTSPIAKSSTKRAGPKWFQAMDRNGDGFLSHQEFLGPPEVFVALDVDRDGFISAAEAQLAKP